MINACNACIYPLVLKPKIPNNLLNLLERIRNTMAFWKAMREQLKYGLTPLIAQPI